MSERSESHALNCSAEGFPRCVDCDADCNEVKDVMDCFLYDPERGYCPYLTGERRQNGENAAARRDGQP